MSVLVAAMDLSGDKDNEDAYVGIVIGVKENIDAMIRHLDLQKFSGSGGKSSITRKKLVKQLDFNNRENIAFCIKIDRHRITNKIKESMKRKHPYVDTTRVSIAFNQHLLRLIGNKILPFVRKHGGDLSNVVFECDSDCRYFLKDNGLRHDGPKYVHILADIIAWANNRGIEPSGVVFFDISEKIERKLTRHFKIKTVFT